MRYISYGSVIALTLAGAGAGACAKPADKPAATAGGVPDFHNPADPGFAQQAPDSFRARFSTTKGDFVIAVHRAWAPLGADRFYNLVRSGYYDGMRFAPFGEVAEGMAVVDSLYGGYGEGAPNGRGPDQMRIHIEGEKYLARQFPKLDKIKKATVE